jgi:acyl dehydratase
MTITDLLHFEDFEVGQTHSFGRYEVTKEEIIEFATEFDPQPFHLYEEAGRRSLLGGLGASGWHTCAMTMRMLADGLVLKAANRGGAGADEARWMKPVRPGDVLRVEADVVETRVSKSLPDVGFVKLNCRVFNQREQVAMISMTPIVARRGH